MEGSCLEIFNETDALWEHTVCFFLGQLYLVWDLFSEKPLKIK